jgi:hypothetical protein
MPITINGVTVNGGCFVAGHHGQYAYDAIAGIADAILGTRHADTIATARRLDDPNLVDILVDVADKAMEELNLATTGGSWDWSDGEIFLIDDADIEVDA